MIEIIPNWHPILVHFTVALLSGAVLLHLVTPLLPAAIVRDELKVVARWSLWLGALLAIATATAGWFAYNSVTHDDVSHAAMTEHRNWALVTLALFVFLASWSFGRWWRNSTSTKGVAGAIFMITLAAGGILLASTAWHGAELVYRYGLGVMSLPATEAEEAGHDHAQSQGLSWDNPTGMAAPVGPGVQKPPVHDSAQHTH